MLQALTDRERRTLLAILAVLVLGAAVKLWRWKADQQMEPAHLMETSVKYEVSDQQSMETAFVP